MQRINKKPRRVSGKPFARVNHSSQLNILYPQTFTHNFTYQQVEEETRQAQPAPVEEVEVEEVEDALETQAKAPGDALSPGVPEEVVDDDELGSVPRALVAVRKSERVGRKLVPGDAGADRNPTAEGYACPVVSLIYSKICSV